MTFVVFDRDAKTAPALLFDYQSDTPTLVQVFFDVGTGFKEFQSPICTETERVEGNTAGSPEGTNPQATIGSGRDRWNVRDT